MENTYNIYRVKTSKLPLLIQKITSVGLKEQKKIISNDYTMTFYFSEDLKGNPIWWWTTYKDFFNEGVKEPQNFFYFALFVATKTSSKDSYLVSLGKSHFYLNQFIERDFGINVAIRIADEDSLLLKKSRYFNGTKRQEISSYETFIRDNYEPGESVEYLKIKAIDSDLWSDKSIIFADSIQMDNEKTPIQLTDVFNQIDGALSENSIIRLPKLETITDENLIKKLDDLLLKSLIEGKGNVVLEEFEVFGIDFCFRFLNYSYQIYLITDDRSHEYKKDLGNTIEIQDIFEYVSSLGFMPDLENIKIQFKHEEKGKFTKNLKELLDFYVKDGDITYFLKSGEWCAFNQVFIQFLKQSLSNIPLIPKESLVEAEYQDWKRNKELKIEHGEYVENRITYREYYFNEKMAIEQQYELMDRELKLINSMEKDKKKYKLEVADLYKDNEIISVKISENEMELIYNIEQSKDAITLLMKGSVHTARVIKKAALWFVFDYEITRITEVNSIQFLLAIESWRKLVSEYKLDSTIYVSKHVNNT